MIFLGTVHRKTYKKPVRGKEFRKLRIKMSPVRLKEIRYPHSARIVFFDEIAYKAIKINSRKQRLTALKAHRERLRRQVLRASFKRLAEYPGYGLRLHHSAHSLTAAGHLIGVKAIFTAEVTCAGRRLYEQIHQPSPLISANMSTPVSSVTEPSDIMRKSSSAAPTRTTVHSLSG